MVGAMVVALAAPVSAVPQPRLAPISYRSVWTGIGYDGATLQLETESVVPQSTTVLTLLSPPWSGQAQVVDMTIEVEVEVIVGTYVWTPLAFVNQSTPAATSVGITVVPIVSTAQSVGLPSNEAVPVTAASIMLTTLGLSPQDECNCTLVVGSGAAVGTPLVVAPGRAAESNVSCAPVSWPSPVLDVVVHLSCGGVPVLSDEGPPAFTLQPVWVSAAPVSFLAVGGSHVNVSGVALPQDGAYSCKFEGGSASIDSPGVWHSHALVSCPVPSWPTAAEAVVLRLLRGVGPVRHDAVSPGECSTAGWLVRVHNVLTWELVHAVVLQHYSSTCRHTPTSPTLSTTAWLAGKR